MAVNLVSTPDELSLTRGGRMVYQFSGSGRFLTPGLPSIALLFVSAPVKDGTKLTLRWNGQAHTLVFATDPLAPNEFTPGDGSAGYVDALMAELAGYFPLREAFTLTRNAPDQLPGIILTARKAGKAFNISAVNLPVGTPFGFGNTVFGVDPILRIQYSVYAELWLQRVGTSGDNLDTDYDRVFDPMIETDALGNAQFDVGNTLHSYLTPDLPSWNLPASQLAQYSQRKYYVAYGEASGSPLDIGRIKRDQVRWAYLGGIDYISRAGGGVPFLSTRSGIPADDKALRFGPVLRYVRPDEPQFLTFLNSRADEGSVLLKIVRTYDNNSTNTRLPLLSAQALAHGHKVSFPAGPTQQDLLNDAAPGRTLREYTLQLVRPDGTPLSIAYRYILNYDYQLNTRYFAYLNSLGCIDTLATFGKGSQEMNRFFDQAERYVPAQYEVADGQFVDYNVALQQSVEVATGFRSASELRGWNDFYRSPKRFHLLDGKALPISITNKSIKQAKDGDTVFAHLFQFVYQFRDEFYSDSDDSPMGVPPPGFTPGGDVTIEQIQLIRSVDDTVPDAVRSLSANIINGFRQAAAWGNHALAGYISQGVGNLLWRRLDKKISYTADLTDTPTTRDQAGLTDVSTNDEVKETIGVSLVDFAESGQLLALIPELRYGLGLAITTDAITPPVDPSTSSFDPADFSPTDFETVPNAQ